MTLPDLAVFLIIAGLALIVVVCLINIAREEHSA